MLLKPFTSGNFHEWFMCFDICSDANKWNDEVKAVKLPTLLEGEALASWLELSTEMKKTYAKAKEVILAARTSTRFSALEGGSGRGKWFPVKCCQCSWTILSNYWIKPCLDSTPKQKSIKPCLDSAPKQKSIKPCLDSTPKQKSNYCYTSLWWAFPRQSANN